MRGWRRLGALLLLVGVLLTPAAAPGREAPKEYYFKLAPISVEYWDAEGMYHTLVLELVAVGPHEKMPLEKTLADSIAKELSAIPYEDITRDNPAPLIKSTALGVIRNHPSGKFASEVLIRKLLIR